MSRFQGSYTSDKGTPGRITARGRPAATRRSRPDRIRAPLMVKLAFIGTHGVGKTTLCYDLGAVLRGGDSTSTW